MPLPTTPQADLRTTKEFAIWTAGFFDGEGCVCLYRSRRCYQIHVNITNTVLTVLEEIRSAFEGETIACSKYEGRRACFKVEFRGFIGERVLRTLYPYLRIKRRQAEIGIRFFEIRRGYWDRVKMRDVQEKIARTLDLSSGYVRRVLSLASEERRRRVKVGLRGCGGLPSEETTRRVLKEACKLGYVERRAAVTSTQPELEALWNELRALNGYNVHKGPQEIDRLTATA